MKNKENKIEELNVVYENNKLVIKREIATVKYEDKNNKEVVTEVLKRILTIIDEDNSNNEAIEIFFNLIDNRKEKVHNIDYKSEAEFYLIEWVEAIRIKFLENIDNNYET